MPKNPPELSAEQVGRLAAARAREIVVEHFEQGLADARDVRNIWVEQCAKAGIPAFVIAERTGCPRQLAEKAVREHKAQEAARKPHPSAKPRKRCAK